MAEKRCLTDLPLPGRGLIVQSFEYTRQVQLYIVYVLRDGLRMLCVES